VMAMANHLGIDATLRMVDLLKGDQKAPDFAAMNPNMRMPVLKDGDYVLWESDAILQYLAGQKPGNGLFPSNERARLDITRWQFWGVAHWDPACAVLIFENLLKPAILKMGDPDPAAVAKGTETFHRVAQVLDGQLKGRTFVAGETLTLADFSLGAPMNLAELAGIPVGSYGEINRWYGTLRALPSWEKTLAQCALPASAAA
jgi:glutathione S-transferase